MDSTVKVGIKGKIYIITMDKEINELRKALWRTIHSFSGKIAKADVAMALGIVQYELIHHNEKGI